MSNKTEEARAKPTAKPALVPKLRFPEFRDAGEWEEKQVEDSFLVCSSKRVLQEDWTDYGVPFYRTRELVSLDKNEPFSSEIFISEDLFSEISHEYGLPAEGDFLVSGVGTLGISYQVQAGDRFYFKDGNVLWFKSKGNIVSSYFKYQLQSYFMQNQILSQSSASTVGTYTIQNAKKTKFWHPTHVEEQQKIADCLSSIDELITLETQKIDVLKAHKKGLMQQLFPAEGETLPKLRFPEFRDAREWEEKTLSTLAENLDNRRIPVTENDRLKGEIPYYGASGIVDYIHDFIFDEDLLCISEDGANLVARSTPIAFSITGKTWVNNHAHVLKFERRCTQKIVEDYLNSISLEDYLTGMAQPKLNRAMLDTINVPIPRDEYEQQKIADCLSSIDELIALEAQKLDALKAHKKGLMQQLFPVSGEVRK